MGRINRREVPSSAVSLLWEAGLIPRITIRPICPDSTDSAICGMLRSGGLLLLHGFYWVLRLIQIGVIIVGEALLEIV